MAWQENDTGKAAGGGQGAGLGEGGHGHRLGGRSYTGEVLCGCCIGAAVWGRRIVSSRPDVLFRPLCSARESAGFW